MAQFWLKLGFFKFFGQFLCISGQNTHNSTFFILPYNLELPEVRMNAVTSKQLFQAVKEKQGSKLS